MSVFLNLIKGWLRGLAIERLGLDQRHHDKKGETARKHGSTLIGTLRKIYGQGFAPRCGDDEKLSDVLEKLHEHSLSQLVHDHHHAELCGRIAKAAASYDNRAEQMEGRIDKTIRATRVPPPDHSEPIRR
jgi:hypothetical protein